LGAKLWQIVAEDSDDLCSQQAGLADLNIDLE
jgi:hypothetical protein